MGIFVHILSSSGDDMKGLIYKDIILSKKFYIIAFLYCMIIDIIAVLMRISMICGNLANNEEVLNSLTRNMYIFHYVPCLILLIAFSSDSGTIFSDINSGWMRFCNTTPVTSSQTALSKMLSKLIVLSFAYIVCMIYISVFCIVGGEQLSFELISTITGMFFLALSFAYISIALSYFFSKRQTVELIMCSAGLIASFLLTSSMILKLDTMEGVSEDFDLLDFFRTELSWIRPYFLLAAFGIFIITSVVCYFLSVNGLQRRDN